VKASARGRGSEAFSSVRSFTGGGVTLALLTLIVAVRGKGLLWKAHWCGGRAPAFTVRCMP